ncbi:MAG TPA: winged helix-turn-helix domain-containing protein [Acidobacteriaceae bacterium]|jgi:GntR family transcriptional regulator/MocR family aminotransferase|nr:winged helix-turn-helix domain-containing protein [Acidobacteriaceae bacterium]
MAHTPFIVPDLALDRNAELPLQKQVYRQITAAIGNGKLPKGAKLPSTRMLAKLLKVSRGTVVAAYEDLLADSLIEAQQRSGVRVAAGKPAPGLSLFGLRAAVRAAQFPSRVQPFDDPDGNSMYINVR